MIDFLATLPHYADHLLPIWWALPPDERGTFYVGRNAAERVAGEGIPAVRGTPDRPARLVVVAAFRDLLNAGRRPVVLVEHGAGQSYDGDPRSRRDASYSGGRERDRAVLFVVPNERVADRNRQAYPQIPNAVVGSPRLDAWALPTRKGDISGKSFTANVTPTVAFSFHWDCRLVPETRWALPHYAEHLPSVIGSLRRSGVQVIGHGHPRAWDRLGPLWERWGVEPVQDFGDVLDRADLFVADNTSALYEFAALDRPVVVLNAPWYRRDVEHGLRFWTHSRLGTMVDNGDQLEAAIHSALADDATTAAMRRQIVRAVFPMLDGQAAYRAAAAIVDVAADHPDDERAGTMGNPKAPRRRKVELTDQFPAARLERIGATPDEIQAARDDWDKLDTAERREVLEHLGQLNDEELAEDLMEGRAQRAAEEEDGGPDDPDWSIPEADGGPTEEERQAEYADLIASGLSGAEAQGTVWPTGEAPAPVVDLMEDAAGRLDQPPSKVLRWVGTDRQRAAAVMASEMQAGNRPAVIDGCRQVLDAP